MEKIQIIGKKNLTKEETETITKLSEEFYPKVKRIIKKIEYIAIHVKKSAKTGERNKYEVIIKIVAPLPKIEASATEWSINKAVHDAFNEIIKVIEHKLHK